MDHIQTKSNIQDLVYAHAHTSKWLQSFSVKSVIQKCNPGIISLLSSVIQDCRKICLLICLRLLIAVDSGSGLPIARTQTQGTTKQARNSIDQFQIPQKHMHSIAAFQRYGSQLDTHIQYVHVLILPTFTNIHQFLGKVCVHKQWIPSHTLWEYG